LHLARNAVVTTSQGPPTPFQRLRSRQATDLRAIAKHGYAGVLSTDPDQRGQALSQFIHRACLPRGRQARDRAAQRALGVSGYQPGPRPPAPPVHRRPIDAAVPDFGTMAWSIQSKRNLRTRAAWHGLLAARRPSWSRLSRAFLLERSVWAASCLSGCAMVGRSPAAPNLSNLSRRCWTSTAV
jgi:hypothetical protein